MSNREQQLKRSAIPCAPIPVVTSETRHDVLRGERLEQSPTGKRVRLAVHDDWFEPLDLQIIDHVRKIVRRSDA